MGLFSKKGPCAICGRTVTGLYPWKIEGQFICEDCHGIIDMEMGRDTNLTMDEFRTYRVFREENQKLREQFGVSDKIDFGFNNVKFIFDNAHHLFCLSYDLRKTIFRGCELVSFTIKLDTDLLFEGSLSGLVCNSNTIIKKAMESKAYKKFYVDLYFNHPYWSTFHSDKDAPTYDMNYPDMNTYVSEFQKNIQDMEHLAQTFMKVAFSKKVPE